MQYHFFLHNFFIFCNLLLFCPSDIFCFFIQASNDTDNKKCPNMIAFFFFLFFFLDREPDRYAQISYSDRRGYHYVLICLEKVTGHHYLTKIKYQLI
jgi:hypothetical protein